MADIRSVNANAQPLPEPRANDHCPTCAQPIPRELSKEISARIAAREVEDQRRLAEELQRLKDEIEAQNEAALAAAREEAKRSAEAEIRARLGEIEAARRAVEAELTAVRQAQETIIAERVAEAREAAERSAVAAVQAEQAKAFDDKQKLQSKIMELQRQLESKTAQELGEGPEIDLYEVLKAEFPEDRISRVAKGASGADVHQDIYHNGRFAGRIIYDSKNRSAWRNDYVSKLRQDQIEANADHAVLSSKVFPANVRELHLQEGVLVVSPGRILVVASLLRRHVVQGHALRQSNEARQQKTDALYAFILSERCGHLLSAIEVNADAMVDLDRKEERQHQATWKRRGELIRSVQKAHGDLSFEIDRIIGTAGNRAPSDDTGG